MATRSARKKLHGARLQTPPADQRGADSTGQTLLHPTLPTPSPEATPNARNDEETKESEPPLSHVSVDEETKESDPPEQMPRGDLFQGHKFYLARTLRAERRVELRMLITQNGGEVVAKMAGGSVEIVERGWLKPGEDWVAAEFIEDSIQDGELKNVVHYLAPPAEKSRRTPSGRPPKRFFTVDEQAKMLQYLRDKHPKFFNSQSVPESVWKLAAAEQLIDRTSSSMHEHYRKQLARLTMQERAVVLDKAGLANLDQQSAAAATDRAESETTKTERRPRLVAAKGQMAADAEEEGNAQDREDEGNESDDEIQGRAKKRVKKTASRTPEHEGDMNEEEEEKGQEAEAETPEQHTPEEDTMVLPSDDEVATPRLLTPPPTDKPIDKNGAAEETAVRDEEEQAHNDFELPTDAADENDDEEEGQDDDDDDGPLVGEVLSSYWQAVVSNASTRPQLDRFFIPPPPPPAADDSPTALLHSVHRTPQPKRVHRLSHAIDPFAATTPKKHATPKVTPQKRRRSGRFSLESMSTPGRAARIQPPPRSAPQELLSQLEEMVGQRMTPPSKRKSLDRLIPVSEASADDADVLLSQLQFETGHDLNTVCSALYWASGDRDVARAFLLGHAPAEIWCPHDDQLLNDFKREDISDVELANARHRGVFDTMTTKRTTRDILNRIRFLL